MEEKRRRSTISIVVLISVIWASDVNVQEKYRRHKAQFYVLFVEPGESV